jgi:hypothetical protein
MPWPKGRFYVLTHGVPYTFHIRASLTYSNNDHAKPITPESQVYQTHDFGSGSCGTTPGGPGIEVGDAHPGTFSFWDEEWNFPNGNYVGHFTKGKPFNLTVKELLQQKGDPIPGYAKLYQDGKLISEVNGVNVMPPPCSDNEFWNFGPYSYYLDQQLDPGVEGTSEETYTEMTVTTP